MGIHDGHRARLRDCFRKDGLAGFDGIRALELLLQYAIPRRDTNPIAHALLDRFGSLQAVFDASEQELCEVEGIGPAAAVLIRLVPQLARKSAVDKAAELQYIQSTADAKDYLNPRFLFEQDEIALLLCLDSTTWFWGWKTAWRSRCFWASPARAKPSPWPMSLRG